MSTKLSQSGYEPIDLENKPSVKSDNFDATDLRGLLYLFFGQYTMQTENKDVPFFHIHFVFNKASRSR